MNVTQLRLAGQGAWPGLAINDLSPELNVFFGVPRSGKSTVGRLAAHLLYGKTDSQWRQQHGASTPLAEGSIEVSSPQGKYLLRRHRDGTAQGRLSIASTGGAAVDSGTVRSLLHEVSPRLLAELYAVDFAQPPRPALLLAGEFAREFAIALNAENAHEPAKTVCELHSSAAPRTIDARHVDDLVRRRDGVVRQIEEQMNAHRHESGAVDRELKNLEAALADRRKHAEQLQTKLRAAELRLAEMDATLRYFTLESAVRRGPAIDEAEQREAIERLDDQINRCRQMLSDLQSRDAAVKRELATVHPDGTADSADSLADQRATVGVLERLLDDLDAEVSQLARSHEPGRCVECDWHVRLSPVAQMLRQQLYTLCGQVTEQERTVKRLRLQAEVRQLARAQTDLSEQLEHLLQQRQSLVHETQLAQRPVILLPQAPAAAHCQCEGHSQFVRDADAMQLAAANRGRREDTARSRRGEQERERNHLRAACDAIQQEIASLESRWQRLQRDRGQATGRSNLDELRGELARLEAEIDSALNHSATVLPGAHASDHRRPWKASDALAQLTDGRLVQIRMSREGSGASIVDRHGRTLSLAELNPAESDQLYLALTLALVSSFASRGIDLPLVLDEPFLRQDARNAAAMAGVLHEFAGQGRQVIVLTKDREAGRRFESLGVMVRDLDSLRNTPSAAVATVTPTIVPVEQPATPTTTVRLVRETIGERQPQLRVAGEWQNADEEREAYYLALDAGIGDFPVLGNDTAKLFAALGIRTVADLLAADADDVATQLNRTKVAPATVRLWQSHMSLMCFVPGLSLNDAQVLAANEVNSPEALFTVDVRLLADSIGQFLGTSCGRQFAALGEQFTRERLAQLQKLARGQRDRWQSIRDRLTWIDRPAAPAATKPRLSVRQPRKRVAASIAAPKAPRKRRPLRFLLDRQHAIVDAPSIGPRTAELLTNVGIRTVADLLNANPDSTAAEIGNSRITAEVISRWQREARLACRIPELSSRGARLLVACGYSEPEQVAGAAPSEVAKKVQDFCRTPQGTRLLAGGPIPSRTRIAGWISLAAQMRPLEAA